MALSIGNADISRLLFERTKWALRGTNINVYEEGVEKNISNSNITVFVFVIPGTVYEAELGGQDALSRRVGTLRISISIQYKTTSVTEGLRIADLIEEGFRRVTLPTPDGKGCVVCDEPWTENRGKDPTSRHIVITTVPWHVFFRQEYSQ